MRWKDCFALIVCSSALATLARAAPPAKQPQAELAKVTITQVEDERTLVRVHRKKNT